MFSSVDGVDDELNKIHFPVNIQSKDPGFQSDIFFNFVHFSMSLSKMTTSISTEIITGLPIPMCYIFIIWI